MSAKPSLRTNLPALINEAPLTRQPPALVLFGRNRGGKPCAAWFDGNQAEAATALAVTMKLRVLPVADDEQRALALQLAHGRILPSGKAHVPGARRDLYGRLVALAGESAGLSITERPEERGEQTCEADAFPWATLATAKSAEAEPSSAPAATSPVADVPKVVPAVATADTPAKPRPGDGLFVGEVKPTTREQIGLGSIVLAQEGPDEGWWEAEVIGCNGRVFSLRWRDYDPVAFPTVLRELSELALLPLREA
ncbi:hypothetical protein [Methylobacterium sp. Leaf89]|uniref:hypothetical protein n=1 Tax=Methylobacterium sp. Leaf89 TaxID=1736245 RepID=UPI000700D942|nr:hypothetical protein [Methylobacterium sp. Leaf89]KQO66382.1 hypothetical protein ASF18_12910 [Methylobacterium sp. Leaf89]